MPPITESAPDDLPDDFTPVSHNYRTFCVDRDTLVAMMMGDISVHIKGLPEGAAVRNVMFPPDRNGFVFLVEHESFSPVALGAMIPSLDVWVTMLKTQG